MENQNSNEDEYIRNTFLQMPKNPNIRIGMSIYNLGSEYQANIPSLSKNNKIKRNTRENLVIQINEDVNKPNKKRKFQ